MELWSTPSIQTLDIWPNNSNEKWRIVKFARWNINAYAHKVGSNVKVLHLQCLAIVNYLLLLFLWISWNLILPRNMQRRFPINHSRLTWEAYSMKIPARRRRETNFEPLPTNKFANRNMARSGEKRNTQPVVCQEQSLGTWQKCEKMDLPLALSGMQIYCRLSHPTAFLHEHRPEAFFTTAPTEEKSVTDKLDFLLFERRGLLRRIHCFRLMRAWVIFPASLAVSLYYHAVMRKPLLYTIGF